MAGVGRELNPDFRSGIRVEMDDALEALLNLGSGGEVQAGTAPLRSARAEAAVRANSPGPGESLADFKKRTQAAVDSGTYVPPQRSAFGADTANAALDLGRKLVGGVFATPVTGTTAATASAPKAPTAAPAAVAVPASPQEPAGAGGAGAKPHPLSKFKDVYDYAASLDDKKFKQFVDLNIDNPDFKGIGYVESGGKLEKVISKPEAPALPRMTPDQAVAASHLLGVGERNDLQRERNAEIKRYNDIRAEDVDLRRQQTKELKNQEMAMKSADAFGKHLELVSPTVGTDETGKPIKARDIGLLDIMDSGQKFRDRAPDLYPAAKQLWDTRERQIRDQILAAKGEYRPEDINKPGTKTYAAREVAKKYYREALLKRYGATK